MKVIGTGLGLGNHHCRCSFAELGVEVLRGDLDLGYLVHGGVDDNGALERILVVRAIEVVGNAGEGLSVHGNRLGSRGSSSTSLFQPIAWAPGSNN